MLYLICMLFLTNDLSALNIFGSVTEQNIVYHFSVEQFLKSPSSATGNMKTPREDEKNMYLAAAK